MQTSNESQQVWTTNNWAGVGCTSHKCLFYIIFPLQCGRADEQMMWSVGSVWRCRVGVLRPSDAGQPPTVFKHKFLVFSDHFCLIESFLDLAWVIAVSPQCMKSGSVTGRVGVKLGSVGLRRVGVLWPSGNGRLPLFLTLIFGFLRSHVGLSHPTLCLLCSPLCMKLGSVGLRRFGVLRPSGDGRSGHSYNGAAARSFCCFFWRIMTLLLTIIWTYLDLLRLLLIICSFRWLQLFRVSETSKDCDQIFWQFVHPLQLLLLRISEKNIKYRFLIWAQWL